MVLTAGRSASPDAPAVDVTIGNRGDPGGEGVATPYELVTASNFAAAVASIQACPLIALDVETTGLNSRRDRLRLLTLGTGDRIWIADAAAVDLGPLIEALRDRSVVGHNVGFDLAFLAPFGLEAESVHDTLVLDHLVHSGEQGIRHSLAEASQRELGVLLSKELQASDWSGPLAPAQYAYAARDVAVLIPLYERLRSRVQEGALEAVAEIEERCIPAIVWMSRAGVPVDGESWRHLAREIEKDAAILRAEMDRTAPMVGVLDLGLGWNWDSPQEVMAALRSVGCEVEATNDEALSAVSHPLAAILRRYRENRKLASTYGLDWLEHLDDGRVYPGWRQLGASSGRMACSSPNLQQIPRAKRFRACIAAPHGRVLIKADYSQIELRIVACVTRDPAMIDAYRAGQDLHTLTAQRVLRKETVTREDRQLAKAVNFGLLYGMGAEGFRRYARTQYSVELSEEEAVRYRNAFFDAYPALRTWHQQIRNTPADEARTLCGRRRLLDSGTPLPLRLNLPIQGTGADGLKRALALLWKRRGEQPDAVPVLACHDEIVVECPSETAGQAAAWLRRAMIDGMAPLIRPVPVEVEVTIGKNWAGDPVAAGAPG